MAVAEVRGEVELRPGLVLVLWWFYGVRFWVWKGVDGVFGGRGGGDAGMERYWDGKMG